MPSVYYSVVDSIRRNDMNQFSKGITFFNKMEKGITKECIKFQRWDMLEKWSNYNLKIKKPYK